MSFPKEKLLQEAEYDIPYHYLVNWRSLLGFPEKLQTCPTYLYYLQEIIAKMGHMERGMKVLDAGCGDGRLIYELRNRGCSAQLTGVDYSERAIQFARIYNPGIDFRLADLTKSDSLPNEKFDVVVSVETLEHIEPSQLTTVIEILMSRVRSGGTLVVTVPHKNRPLDSKHYQHFTEQSLRLALHACCSMMELHGFNRKSYKQLVLRIIVALFYYSYPLKKAGLTPLVNSISNWGFKFFEDNLLRCSPDDGYSLIAVCRKSG